MKNIRETPISSPEEFVRRLPQFFFSGEGQTLHDVSSNVQLPLAIRIRAADEFTRQYNEFDGKRSMLMLNLIDSLPHFTPSIRTYARLLEDGVDMGTAARRSNL